MGSTRALTDGTGAATDTYDYLAFGELLNSSGSTENNYLFAGEQYDPNARFYYLRARWMNPEIGRFLSRDPFEGVNADPVTLHKYLYTANNPAMFVDPSGESYSLAGMMADIGTIYALGSIAIPNFMRFIVKAEGQTDTFTIQFFSGGSLGKGFYGGAIDAYIWEEHPSNPKLHIQAKRQMFTVILVGYGYGAGFTLVEWSNTFKTKGNRKLLSFAGYGRISSAVEVGYKGLGSFSYSELQFPEGTWIKPKISIKPGVTRGFSVYLCAAIFIPLGPQDNVP